MSTPTTVDDVFNIFKRMNPLIQHASEGNVEQVRDLLAQGNAFDQAAAMGAAMCGQVECLKLFLPFSNTHNWNSALIAATMDGHETCVKALLDTQPNDWKAGVKDALTDSVRFNHGHCTERLVKHIETMEQQHPTESAFIDWNAVLLKSLEFSNTQAFFAVFPHCDSTWLATCLEGASNKGLKEIVQTLAPMSAQLDPNLVHNSLMKAIWKGHEDIVKILLPWVDIQLDDSIALRTAIELGDNEIAELLYDGSDLDVALNWLKPKKLPQEYLHRLNELIQNRTQNCVLTHAVNENTAYANRPKKM